MNVIQLKQEKLHDIASELTLTNITYLDRFQTKTKRYHPRRVTKLMQPQLTLQGLGWQICAIM